jgi:hypothetical protein
LRAALRLALGTAPRAALRALEILRLVLRAAACLGGGRPAFLSSSDLHSSFRLIAIWEQAVKRGTRLSAELFHAGTTNTPWIEVISRHARRLTAASQSANVRRARPSASCRGGKPGYGPAA